MTMQSYTNKSSRSYLLTLLCLMALAACKPGKKAPDVSHIPVTVNIARFDKALFGIDTLQTAEGLKKLYAAYPAFLPAWLEHIMNFGRYNDSSAPVAAQTRALLGNRDFRQLQDSVQAHFHDLRWLENELAQAFRYTKYYFPAFRPPRVVTFTSAVSNYGAITADSILGIGLDMYMGSGFPVYGMLPDLPDYLVRRFSPEYITANCLQVLQQQLYPMPGPGSRLIEQFVAAGKQQYFLEQVLPETPDTIRLGYTKDQLDWCLDNERMIWQYFIQNELLYKADWQEAMHFIGDGPSTQGMPPGAPGRIGYFVGWRIMQKYMDGHPEVTLQQLMEIKDLVQVFNGSKYRPRKG